MQLVAAAAVAANSPEHPHTRLLNRATAKCCCHIFFSAHLNAKAAGRGVGRNQGQAQLRRPSLRPRLQERQARQACGSVASFIPVGCGAACRVAWLLFCGTPRMSRCCQPAACLLDEVVVGAGEAAQVPHHLQTGGRQQIE